MQKESEVRNMYDGEYSSEELEVKEILNGGYGFPIYF